MDKHKGEAYRQAGKITGAFIRVRSPEHHQNKDECKDGLGYKGLEPHPFLERVGTGSGRTVMGT